MKRGEAMTGAGAPGLDAGRVVVVVVEVVVDGAGGAGTVSWPRASPLRLAAVWALT